LLSIKFGLYGARLWLAVGSPGFGVVYHSESSGRESRSVEMKTVQKNYRAHNAAPSARRPSTASNIRALHQGGIPTLRYVIAGG
jgi:hypothetical protein